MSESTLIPVDVVPDDDLRIPARRGRGVRVWAGASLAVVGLGLLGLGGCFLIGAWQVLEMYSTKHGNFTATGDAAVLVHWCYGAALACFLIVLPVLLLAIRGLARIMLDDGRG